VIVSSHVLTDIEQTCDWVVMLDAGQLLRSGPLGGFEKLGTVVVEVLERPEDLAARIRERGIDVVVDERRLVVGPGDESIEQIVVAAAADLDSGLVRMIRGSASLEDLFLSNEEAK
jgi:ABC-type multidrug transport system ATPase subunit